MKITVRGIAISVVIISTAIATTHLLLARISSAKREPSIKVNHYNDFLHHSTLAVDKEEVLANEQKRKEQIVRPLDQVPMECEGAASRLDFAVIDTKKLDGAYLIIIARLGTGETSGHLNQIRLAVAEEYVLRRGSDLKYVLAQGKRVKGLGRLELYVGGRLNEILPFKRNAKGHCLPGREGN